MTISRKYEVQGQLGRGSMGVVYKVRHLSLDTISALKALPPYLMENPELVKRIPLLLHVTRNRSRDQLAFLSRGASAGGA